MPNIFSSTSYTSFSFFNQALDRFTQSMNGAWSVISPYFSGLLSSSSQLSFYQQAGTEPGFQHYQRWCSELKQIERDLLSAMEEKKLSPKAVRKGLLTFINQLEKNIVSPIYFHYRLNHLKQKMVESHYPVIFQTMIEETQARLKDKLQQQPESALKYFYEDLVNSVVELSGKKIAANELLENLNYYQTLVPISLYEEVISEVQSFIQTHEKKYAVPHNIYDENNIAASDYAALIKNVNACFEIAMVASEANEIDVATENPDTQQNHQTHLPINWRFLGFAALAGTSAYLYRHEFNQAFTTANYHFNMMKQMPWHVAQQVDWSTGFFPSWNTLTQATLSYGFYQRLSLTEKPIVWSAITLLWTTLPKSMAQVIELSSLNGTNGFVMDGVHAEDYSGWAISSGDVNGDNITDILIGAYDAGLGGASYVVFGQRGVWPASMELSSLNGTNGFVMNGVNAKDYSGYAISSGDVNGDTITDVLIGAPAASPDNRTYTGAGYVVFGRRGIWPASIELSHLNGTNGFVMNGVNANDTSGSTISSGDVNGDGIVDVLMGASGASPGGRNGAGASYVVFGHREPWPASLELSSLNGTSGFVINGVNPGDASGVAISSGDVNGDTITDVLIGASWASPDDRTKAGASYVVFGGQGPWPTALELSSLNGTNGLVMNGVNATDETGYAISSGDINGDNISDALIGAFTASPGNRTFAGASYVVFGSRGPWPASLELSSLNGTNGFVMNGVNEYDEAGNAISSGDVNGDGMSDVLIGARYAKPDSKDDAGASYVVFGARGVWPAALELSSLSDTNGSGFVINGANIQDASGWAISSGDVNGDGIADVLIGATGASPGGRSNAGASYVVFGSRKSSPFTTGQVTTASSTPFTHETDFIVGLSVGSLVITLIGVGGAVYCFKKKYRKPDPLFDPSTRLLEEKSPHMIKNYDAIGERPIAYEELTLEKEIGRGSFGIVYKGTYRHAQVAIKQLVNQDFSAKAFKDFKQEILIMEKLHSPYIVHLYGTCFNHPYYSLVMEYMPKGSLYEVLHSEEKLAWEVRGKIALDIAKGLAFLHAAHIIHRDLKSLNVLLDNNYQAKLCDFGLAKIKAETTTTTKNDKAVGTVAWMAPELFEIQASSSAKAIRYDKADMYSYGMVLWELASCKIPYEQIPKEVLPTQIKAGLRETIPENTPLKLAKLIQWCWEKTPQKRPSAEEAIQQFSESEASVQSDYRGAFASMTTNLK